MAEAMGDDEDDDLIIEGWDTGDAHEDYLKKVGRLNHLPG